MCLVILPKCDIKNLSYIPKIAMWDGFVLQTRLNTVKIVVYDKKKASKEQLAISN